MQVTRSCASASQSSRRRASRQTVGSPRRTAIAQFEKAHAKQKQAEALAKTASNCQQEAEREALKLRGENEELRAQVERLQVEADALSALNTRIGEVPRVVTECAAARMRHGEGSFFVEDNAPRLLGGMCEVEDDAELGEPVDECSAPVGQTVCRRIDSSGELVRVVPGQAR